MFQALQWKDEMDRERQFAAPNPKARSSSSKRISGDHRMVRLTGNVCAGETKRDSSP